MPLLEQSQYPSNKRQKQGEIYTFNTYHNISYFWFGTDNSVKTIETAGISIPLTHITTDPIFGLVQTILSNVGELKQIYDPKPSLFVK